MKKIVLFFLVVIFIMTIAEAESPKKDKKGRHVVVINPGSGDALKFSSDWGPVMDGRHIYEWGRTHNLYLVPDGPALKDDLAAYLGPGGETTLTVKGLKTGAEYFLWADFVVFRNPDGISVPSYLKIYIRGRGYDYRQVACYRFNDMKKGTIKVPVPYEFSASGKINILFKEYSPSGSTWGIWDLVVSDTDEYPADTHFKKFNKTKQLEYKRNILE